MEWLVEKLTETGIDKITFLKSAHAVKKKLNLTRIIKKAESAMKQSFNPWLPQVHSIVPFHDFIKTNMQSQKFIARMTSKADFLSNVARAGENYCLMVGPEGDFSEEEFKLALQHNYVPVLLSKNRLRTETAGLVGCLTLNFINTF